MTKTMHAEANELLISIVIPVYNKQDVLPRCFASLSDNDLSQVEVLGIDDGSTDDSKRVLAELAETLPCKVHLLAHKTNKGTFATRASGIRAATAQYILFLDADDTLEPDALALIKARLQSAQPDFFLYDWHYLTATGNPLYIARSHASTKPNAENAIASYARVNPDTLGTGGKVIRTAIAQQAIEMIGECNEQNLFEDQLLLLICATLADSYDYLAKPLYRYYRSPSAITMKAGLAEKYHQAERALATVSKVAEQLTEQHSVHATRVKRLQTRCVELARRNDFMVRREATVRSFAGKNYAQCVISGCRNMDSVKPWLALTCYVFSLSLIKL